MFQVSGSKIICDTFQRSLGSRQVLVTRRSFGQTTISGMQKNSKPYTLYTAGTPNGWKPSIALEELGASYEVRKIDLSKNEQKEDWFLKINPNGRIPALVDHEADISIFESGAILWYLAEKDPEHRLVPEDTKKKTEVSCWLMFQMGGVGPMQGQANHFVRYAPEKIPYGITRYQNETNRLYEVLDKALEGKEYLANNEYSIADIANFTWVFCHCLCGISIDDKPNLKAWLARIESRPAVQRGLDVPEKNKVKEMAAKTT